MKSDKILELLSQVQKGTLSPTEAESAIMRAVTECSGAAPLPVPQAQLNGFPAVVYGEHLTAEQIAERMQQCAEQADRVIAVKVSPDKAELVENIVGGITYHETAGAATWFRRPILRVRTGYVAVVCAGATDLPVAEEAAVTLECMGSHAERVYDVAISGGIHRLFAQLDRIRSASVIVVVAGIESALVSVVSGLARKPVIAVPASASLKFGAAPALLSLMDNCPPGVSVVRPDNGFAAGYSAGLIHSFIARR